MAFNQKRLTRDEMSKGFVVWYYKAYGKNSGVRDIAGRPLQDAGEQFKEKYGTIDDDTLAQVCAENYFPKMSTGATTTNEPIRDHMWTGDMMWVQYRVEGNPRVALTRIVRNEGGDVSLDVVLDERSEDEAAQLPAPVNRPRLLTVVAGDDNFVSLDEGGTATFTLALAMDPGATDVVVTASVSGSSDVTVDMDTTTSGVQSSRTYTSANHATPATIRVSLAEDSDSLDDYALITLTAAGGVDNDAGTTASYAGIITTLVVKGSDND